MSSTRNQTSSASDPRALRAQEFSRQVLQSLEPLLRLAERGDVAALELSLREIESELLRTNLPTPNMEAIRHKISALRSQGYLKAADAALMKSIEIAKRGSGGNRLEMIETARSLLAKAIAHGADRMMEQAMQRKIDNLLYSGPVGVLSVHGRAEARGATAAGRPKSERRIYTRYSEPKLFVSCLGQSTRTIDWSVGGLMLDAELKDVRPEQEVSLTLAAAAAGPYHSVTARVLKITDGMTAIRFLRATQQTVAFLRHLSVSARVRVR